MQEIEAVSSLAGALYDAALEPALWPIALRQLADFVGGSAASVYAKEVATRDVEIYHDDGVLDRSWLNRYRDEYIKFDPSTMRNYLAGVGELVTTTDIMPHREFLDTRFSAEWAQPQSLSDSVSVVLAKSGTQLSMATVFRSTGDGLVNVRARRRLKLMVPHLRRATLTTAAIGEQSARIASLEASLDALETGVLLLDAGGKHVHVNAAGAAMLREVRLFTGSGERLRAFDAATDSAIVCALKALVDGVELAPGSVAIPLRAVDGELYVAHLLPLNGGERRDTVVRSAIAALFVRRGTIGAVAAPEALARAFGLTPTELRTLLALVEIGGGPSLADTLGIAETTVRFHLKGLFEKTGTRRQAELVKLVAGFLPP